MSAKHRWKCACCGAEQIELVMSDEFEMQATIANQAEELTKANSDRELLMKMLSLEEADLDLIQQTVGEVRGQLDINPEDNHATA